MHKIKFAKSQRLKELTQDEKDIEDCCSLSSYEKVALFADLLILSSSQREK